MTIVFVKAFVYVEMQPFWMSFSCGIALSYLMFLQLELFATFPYTSLFRASFAINRLNMDGKCALITITCKHMKCDNFQGEFRGDNLTGLVLPTPFLVRNVAKYSPKVRGLRP